MKKNGESKDKIRMIAIIIVSLLVILTGSLFSIKSFENSEIAGGIVGILIAIIILAFAFFTFRRGNRDIKEGFPLHDERSKRVMEKASSKAFFVSLYLFLIIGFLSDDKIHFRDVSQATGIGICGMALLFALFWVYYNKKEI